MNKIYKETQLLKLNTLQPKVIENVRKVINILNENYGAYRNIESDLGGYIIITESIEEIKELKRGELKGLISEYTELIECENGECWTSSLFLLSCDYSIVIITREELYKTLIDIEYNLN